MKFEIMPSYTKYLCWYETELVKPRSSRFMFWVLTGTAALCLASLKSCHTNSLKPAPQYKTHLTNEQVKYACIFAMKGSTHPVEMACAVTKTKNPPLMAALAIRESNARPQINGDGGNSHGAFQIQPKHWGSVPNTATEQALKAEKILDELTRDDRRRSLRSALARYNGGTNPPPISYRRADRIIRLAKSIERQINRG